MGFINQFPYSDFHELNLDWLIKQTKESMNAITALQEQMAQIEVLTKEQIELMIDQAIEANNQVIAQKLINLKNEITSEYQNYVRNQIDILTVYIDNQDTYYNGLAEGYATTALTESKAYTDNKVIDYTMMINPITGNYDDVRDVVDDIVNYFHTGDSLTAGEYDNLELTADDYDNYELTAYDYDFNGKVRLNP